VGRIERELHLGHAPEAVWSALTDPHRLSKWFGAEVDLDLRPGGRALFRWPNGTTRAATIDVVDHGRYLVLRWLPFEHRAGRTIPRSTTTVEMIVTPEGGGTKIVIVESDAVGGRVPRPQAVRTGS
jgi:uncharacterized protein YndB with AHSA1/START domain